MQIIARASVWPNLEVQHFRCVYYDTEKVDAVESLFKSGKRFVSVVFDCNRTPIRFVCNCFSHMMPNFFFVLVAFEH
jgi:hypothetical protein